MRRSTVRTTIEHTDQQQQARHDVEQERDDELGQGDDVAVDALDHLARRALAVVGHVETERVLGEALAEPVGAVPGEPAGQPGGEHPGQLARDREAEIAEPRAWSSQLVRSPAIAPSTNSLVSWGAASGRTVVARMREGQRAGASAPWPEAGQNGATDLGGGCHGRPLTLRTATGTSNRISSHQGAAVSGVRTSLQGVELGVQSLPLHQLVMAPYLADPSVGDDHDEVGRTHGREAVGHQDGDHAGG